MIQLVKMKLFFSMYIFTCFYTVVRFKLLKQHLFLFQNFLG